MVRTLDNNQANRILYYLDSDKFLNNVVKDEKKFLKMCKEDPMTIRSLFMSYLPRLYKYQQDFCKLQKSKVKQIHFSIRIEEE